MVWRKRTRVALFIAIACSMPAGYWLWDHRGYCFTDHFREINPGRIYAGGYQYRWPLQRILRKYKIRTVLALREGDDAYESQERRVLDKANVRFHKIVIPYKVSDDERIAVIEQAIDFISDEKNQPVYVHCWAGCHRTGAVVAIYRVSRCNWSESMARAELIAWGGTALGTQWPVKALHSYCEAAARRLVSHHRSWLGR
jgi:tyrosine-protein phosphatase SIW14